MVLAGAFLLFLTWYLLLIILNLSSALLLVVKEKWRSKFERHALKGYAVESIISYHRE